MRATHDGALDANAFASTLSMVRGADMTALVRECFRSDAVFDYAIDDVRSSMSGDGSMKRRSRWPVTERASSKSGATATANEACPCWCGSRTAVNCVTGLTAPHRLRRLVYTAKSPVVQAAVDPEVMLLLDVNRANNTFATSSPIRPLGIRLALHWMSWLQHTMLAYTALV